MDISGYFNVVVALEGAVIKGGPNKVVPPQEVYSPSSKTEDNLITAPFLGWSLQEATESPSGMEQR
jgi:hypothetical protein